MALICNVVQNVAQTEGPEGHSSNGDWGEVYRRNERFIESGSAYFSQAFAEALGLVSDLELHNRERAQLRLASISALLGHSVEQYSTSLDIDDRSGLAEHHEATLHRLGLDLRGTEQALTDGRHSGYIVADDHLIRRLALLFHEQGYRALMDAYLEKVISIQSLIRPGELTETVSDWQGLTWQLTSAFTDAMMFGQCIAVMNAVAYR